MTDSIKSVLEKAAVATTQVRDRVVALRKTIEDLARRIRHEQEAPVPLAEIDGRVPEVVAAHGAAWARMNGDGLLHGAGVFPGFGSPHYRGSVLFPDGMADDWFGALCLARPDEAADLLRRLVHAIPFEPGTTSAERPAAIEKLNAQLAERQAEEECAVDEAQAAGLDIEARPDVVERRQREARKRELEEQAIADRQRRQAQLDAEFKKRTRDWVLLDEHGDPPRRRVSPSEHIAGGAVDRSRGRLP